jgi:RNA polymerase primary sigma factor
MNSTKTESAESGFQIYLREIGQIPLLTPEEEVELAGRIRAGDAQARTQMIRCNLRLVVRIAHDYANLGMPLPDLISEGNIGLMKAVERFDPSKGGKLSTYAAWWIKQSIKRALANQSKTIRLPVHLVDKISKMRRVAAQMSEELGREPTDQELAEEVGLSAGKISLLKTASTRPASLDAPLSEEDSTEFGEMVRDTEARDPFEELRDNNLREELGDLLGILDERERKIIFSRFGLDGGKARTLEEVGLKFGVTRERIRQLQNTALGKLRRALQKREKPVSPTAPQSVSPAPLVAGRTGSPPLPPSPGTVAQRGQVRTLRPARKRPAVQAGDPPVRGMAPATTAPARAGMLKPRSKRTALRAKPQRVKPQRGSTRSPNRAMFQPGLRKQS